MMKPWPVCLSGSSKPGFNNSEPSRDSVEPSFNNVKPSRSPSNVQNARNRSLVLILRSLAQMTWSLVSKVSEPNPDNVEHSAFRLFVVGLPGFGLGSAVLGLGFVAGATRRYL